MSGIELIERTLQVISIPANGFGQAVLTDGAGEIKLAAKTINGATSVKIGGSWRCASVSYAPDRSPRTLRIPR